MALQLSHNTVVTTKVDHKIIVLCDGVSSPANIGGLFRICDALGVSKLIFCHAEIDLHSSRVLRTARNTVKTVPFEISPEDSLQVITTYKKNDFQVIALELAKDSISIKNFSSGTARPTILVIGNERNGVSEKILRLTDHNVYIPMHGKNSSMNVVQATAIALYALT